MVFASMGVAFAATTLKVDPVDGHKYTAYQLFVGDLSGTTLSNVKWGSDVKTTEITYNTDKKVTPVVGEAVPQDVLDYFAGLSGKTNDDAAQATADAISAFVDTSKTGTALSSEDVEVDFGYYVVVDEYTDATKAQTTTLSTNVVAIVGPTEIKPKAGTTTHTKKVLDVNDTTDTKINLNDLKGITSGWDKTADHDIGDKVPFMLTTTIASDFAKYDTYYLAVNDTLKDGLTLDQDSIKVYVDGVEATAGVQNAIDGTYYLTKSTTGFKVEFKNIKGNNKAAAGKDVVVVYTATLGDSAVIGNPGNVNESYAEYSNNPNGGQSGDTHSKTPTDTAVVFTYKTDVDKINKNGVALAGAEFTLYKKYNAAVDGKTNVANTTPAGAKADTFPSGEFWYAVKTVTPNENQNFEFKGIDDGTYILVESKTPDGYNTMDPITLTVTATHGADGDSTTGYSVSALASGNDKFKADAKGGEIKFTKKNNTEKALTTGEIYSEIVNNEGATLPSTGGIGTTIFYIGGSILVLAAVILLVTKRRMGAND